MARLDKLMRRAKLSSAPLCIALIDLVHFKSINDTYGHDADHALRLFARRYMSCIRTSDMLGRIGGKEFILLLPETLPITAGQIVERVLSSLPELTLGGSKAQHMIRLSFSAGISQFLDDDRREEIISRADAALYRAKTPGKGQVQYGR